MKVRGRAGVSPVYWAAKGGGVWDGVVGLAVAIGRLLAHSYRR